MRTSPQGDLQQPTKPYPSRWGLSAEARTRVLAAVERLGYRPNGVARSLRTDQTQTLGLVIPDILNPYFTELARSVEEEARTHGCSVIIGKTPTRTPYCRTTTSVRCSTGGSTDCSSPPPTRAPR